LLSNTKKPAKELSLQQQLVFNERRFRSLVENSTDAVAILSKNIKIKYISPAVEGILGYTAEEIMKMDALSTVHPEDMPIVQEALEFAMANPGIPGKVFTARVLHKDQNWRWIETTLTNMLNDPAIDGIVDNFRDITERKEAEEKIRVAEE
jgi:PAS domain S-box-containing protein